VRERESGFRYTPTSCFETFPLPFSPGTEILPENASFAARLDAAKHYAHIVLREEPAPGTAREHCEAISIAALDLRGLRERWLNPSELTCTRVLEFRGSLDGPWGRYVDPATVDSRLGAGTVRYPRIEPRDAGCAAKLEKRTLTNLYNERPGWLVSAHAKLDAAVAAAYGWPADLSDDDILSRLLALNLTRAADEQATVTKPAAKPRSSRAKTAEEML
jgi:hypothetical protein